MNNVTELFDPERYCVNCKRVDCPQHCWGCGTEHDTIEDAYCTACSLEMEDGEVDLGDFWRPPPGHKTPASRRRPHK